MKKLVCILFLFPLLAAAQETEYFKRLYSNGYLESFTSVLELEQGGYIASGFSSYYPTGNTRAYVVKLNSQGDTVWTRLIGDTIYSYNAYNLHLVQGRTDQFMVTGYERLRDSTQASGYTIDWYLMKMDTAGKVLWRKTYQFENRYNYPYRVIPTSDSGYIMVGDTRSQENSQLRYYVIKTDSSGSIQWQKKYNMNNMNDQFPKGIVQTADSGYMISGWSRGYLGPTDYIGYFVILKIDSTGNQKWVKYYGESDQYDGAVGITSTKDGNYVVTGFKENSSMGIANFYDTWVMKINPLGAIIWDRVIHRGEKSNGWYVAELEDESIACVGYVASNHPKAGDNGFLFKLSANGDSLWAREYGYPYVENKPSPPDWTQNFTPTKDGGFILCGFALDFTQSGTSAQDGWLIKLDSLGCPEPGCELDVGMPQGTLQSTGLLFYPNPVSNHLTIVLPAPARQHTSLFVTDMLGRTVYSRELEAGDQQLILETSSWQEGLYQVRILQDGELLYAEKLMRIK